MAEQKIDTLRKVELSEGVEIRLPVAGPLIRSLAWLIDLVIRICLYILVSIVLMLVMPYLGYQVGQGAFMLFMFGMEWFYFVFFEAGKRGATPGKRAMGLRVVRFSGTPISWNQAIIRNFMRFIDFLPFANAIGLLSCTATKNFQRLGDLAANTLVVYDRAPDRISVPLNRAITATPIPMALTPEEQLAVVTYYERAGHWSDARKVELANHVSGLTGTTGVDGVERLLSMGLWIQES